MDLIKKIVLAFAAVLVLGAVLFLGLPTMYYNAEVARRAAETARRAEGASAPTTLASATDPAPSPSPRVKARTIEDLDNAVGGVQTELSGVKNEVKDIRTEMRNGFAEINTRLESLKSGSPASSGDTLPNTDGPKKEIGTGQESLPDKELDIWLKTVDLGKPNGESRVRKFANGSRAGITLWYKPAGGSPNVDMSNTETHKGRGKHCGHKQHNAHSNGNEDQPVSQEAADCAVTKPFPVSTTEEVVNRGPVAIAPAPVPTVQWAYGGGQGRVPIQPPQGFVYNASSYSSYADNSFRGGNRVINQGAQAITPAPNPIIPGPGGNGIVNRNVAAPGGNGQFGPGGSAGNGSGAGPGGAGR